MIYIDGCYLKDEMGRICLLRGVNLSGSSKIPAHPSEARTADIDFYDHRNVSFVGRPFPIEEADIHFKRLKHWGMRSLRFLVTWEAIEHSGPGHYDHDYLDYLYAIVRKAGEYGISLFIDPHQDVWSRYSGGDGAPGWTFETIGLDITRFNQTGAAVTEHEYPGQLTPMIWLSNSTKLAAATMFTLFFGGNDFAPATTIDGESIQHYLQRHYIDAIGQIARRLCGLSNVIGYGAMNEPRHGYIGWKNLHQADAVAKIGALPSPFQSMLLGAGIPQQVGVWKIGLLGPKRIQTRTLNQNGVKVWQPEYECVWLRNRVWDYGANGTPRLLRPYHFSHMGTREVNFSQDYYRPFANAFARSIRIIDPDTLIFIETEPTLDPPCWRVEDARNIVYAPHWYDLFVMFLKDYSPFLGADFHHNGRLVIGPGQVRRSYADQLRLYLEQAQTYFGGVPVLLGEFGIPFDLQHKRAYQSCDFKLQNKALDRSYQAVDDNLLGCMLWNYTPDNTNEQGDHFNGEDFSIYSCDRQFNAGLNAGGRALESVVRPYAWKIAGEPVQMSFERERKHFKFIFRSDESISAPSELYIPDYQYPNGYQVCVSDGTYTMDRAEQLLIYCHSNDQVYHTIEVFPKI